uniref:Protein kinase domain-containing protein n=1 Tax=Panagrellus redivivus TaxID=6233 RepID=A0A7E4V4H9_PANRE
MVRTEEDHHAYVVRLREVPLLSKGQIVCDRFRIEEMIGSGGYGQIYLADMVIDKQELKVALKISPEDVESPRMYLEAIVLTELRGVQCVPHLISCGDYDVFNYIALELLGENLGQLRKRAPHGRLSVGTVLRIGIQAVNALKVVHEKGWLHRDVKPSNFCIGHDGLERHKIFIVDFGLARRYKNPDGSPRKVRPHAPFRGTTRFMSPNMHQRKEHGPVDDLWSLMYTLTELAEGGLPWRLLRDFEDIGNMKRTKRMEEVWRHLPPTMTSFKLHLTKLTYSDTPHYAHLNSVLQKGLPNGVHDWTPYDWEPKTVPQTAPPIK